MKRRQTLIRPALGAAALLTVAGLAVAGCQSSPSASGGGSSHSASASASSGSGSGGSGGSSGGSGSGSVSSTAFFPVGVGNTWVYQTDISGTHGTTITKMTKVVSVPAGQRVTAQVSSDLSGTGAVGHPATVTYLFHHDGSITLPAASGLGTKSARIISGHIIWPSAADLSSGRVRHSTLTIADNILGHHSQLHAHLTIRGAGKQEVTVPAGHYDAQVIVETIRETVAASAISLKLTTWVADGVGPVKTAVQTSTAGHTVGGTTDVLKSFTRG